MVTPNKLPDLLNQFKDNTKTVTYNTLSDTFAVAVTLEEGYYEHCMRIIADLRDEYSPKGDTYNALNEAISALKTIADMENEGE